jgi:hypothetical protein
MQTLRQRLQWRPVFFLVLLIGTPIFTWFARPSAERTDLVRWTMVSVWIAVALLYAFLAWRTRGSSPAHPANDVFPVVAFTAAAIYESNWPGSLPNFTPDTIVMVTSASALGSYWAGRRASREAAQGT